MNPPPQTARSRARTISLLSGLSLLGVLMGGFMSLSREPGGYTRVMPSGHVISLVGFTSGTEHRLDGRRQISRLLARLRLAKRDPRLFYRRTAATVPMFWLRSRTPPAAGSTLFGAFRLEIVDEHGCRFGEPETRQYLFDEFAPREQWYAVSPRYYPRSTERIVLQLWDYRTRKLIERFELPNPLKAPVSAGSREPYPIVRSGPITTLCFVGSQQMISAPPRQRSPLSPAQIPGILERVGCRPR